MTQISPKVIDVEGNRVEYEEGTFEKYSKEVDKNIEYSKFIYDAKVMPHKYRGINKQFTVDEGGRFPTQLFTNNKNDKYKYVKNIS